MYNFGKPQEHCDILMKCIREEHEPLSNEEISLFSFSLCEHDEYGGMWLESVVDDGRCLIKNFV